MIRMAACICFKKGLAARRIVGIFVTVQNSYAFLASSMV
jgi:hypothetical protein